MSRDVQENADKYAAKRVIRRLDMIVYYNPYLGTPPISIPRHLIEGLGMNDAMDASQVIAATCRQAIARLRPLRFGQVEILNLAAPLTTDLHVLIWTQNGEDHFYVNDQPFFPYH
jgi:hypothetical protein